MAKDRIPKDRIDQMLGNPARTTEGTQKEHRSNTQRTRFKGYQRTDLETFSVRLTPDDKRVLQEYFERRSIPMSQGIRQILVDFMEERGLR